MEDTVMQLTTYDRWLLGKLLVDLDQSVDKLDRAVFDAAYGSIQLGAGLDAQRDRAMSEEFQPPVKTQRNRVLEQRNCVARILGFPEHRAHDFAPRGYVVESGEFLRPA